MARLAWLALLVPVLLAVALRMHSPKPNTPETDVMLAFRRWQAEYGMLFASPAEQTYRLEVFASNLAKVKQTNQKALGFELAANQFAHLAAEEFSVMYGGLRDSKALRKTHAAKAAQNKNLLSAQSETVLGLDWNREYSMSDILHQGTCGSCYAWAAADALTHAYYKKTNQLLRFSVQELVDCSKGEGNNGCKGGLPEQAWQYVIKNQGISLDKDYPYRAEESSSCRSDAGKKLNIGIKSTVSINDGDYQPVKAALRESIVHTAICSTDIQLYKSGVMSDPKCKSEVNHAVSMVGYGVSETGEKYWKIRNSWGPAWGEQGHIRVLREEKEQSFGICGILMYLGYPQF